MLEIIFSGTFLILILALAVTFIRFVKGPHAVDRVMCLDLLAMIAAGIIGIYSVQFNQAAFLDIVLILSIITFLGTITFARLIEEYAQKKGKT